MLDEDSCKIHISRDRHVMQWAGPVLILGSRVGAVHDKEPYEIDMIPSHRLMQRSYAVRVLGLGLGRHIGTMLDEESCKIHISRVLARHAMQWAEPILVLGTRVGAVLDEEPCKIYTITIAQCLMQRSPTILVPGCHVGTVLDEEPYEIHIFVIRMGQPMQRCRPELVLGRCV